MRVLAFMRVRALSTHAHAWMHARTARDIYLERGILIFFFSDYQTVDTARHNSNLRLLESLQQAWSPRLPGFDSKPFDELCGSGSRCALTQRWKQLAASKGHSIKIRQNGREFWRLLVWVFVEACCAESPSPDPRILQKCRGSSPQRGRWRRLSWQTLK